MWFLEIDIGRVDVPMDDVDAVYVVDGLGELVEDPPNLILVDPPVISLRPGE